MKIILNGDIHFLNVFTVIQWKGKEQLSLLFLLESEQWPVRCPFPLVSAKRKQAATAKFFSGKKVTGFSIGAAVPAEKPSRLQAGAV